MTTEILQNKTILVDSQADTRHFWNIICYILSMNSLRISELVSICHNTKFLLTYDRLKLIKTFKW